MSKITGDQTSSKVVGPTNMTAYLESILKELESAQGGTDEEAEGALAELKEKMATLAAAESATESDRLGSREGAAPPDDMQLASALDRLDDRLRDLEAQLDSADEPTKQILRQSAELWLRGQGLEEDEDDENGPIKSSRNNSASKNDKT